MIELNDKEIKSCYIIEKIKFVMNSLTRQKTDVKEKRFREASIVVV